MDNKNIEKETLMLHSDYHNFKIRNSWLDLLIKQTKINQSEFKGFLNLVIVLLITYCFTLPISNYFKKGYFFKMELFDRMFKDLFILYFIWPLFHIWTYTAYLHEIMIIKRFPRFFCYMFNIISQYGLLFYVTYRCLNSRLPTPPTLYTITQGLIHFFKMHSYTMTNRDYRENYIRLIKLKKNGKIDENGKLYNKDDTLYANENQKNTENDIGLEHISSYPNNINFKNFFYLLSGG